MSSTRTITFKLNGAPVTADVKPHHNPVEMLQGSFGLTGARETCGQGLCGCCSVVVNGRAVSGCLYLAHFIDGAEVINFSSFNYLGMSGHSAVADAMTDAVYRWGSSCSASRLLAGEKPIHRELELELASQLEGSDWVTLDRAAAGTGASRAALRTWYRTGQIPSRLVDVPHGPQRLVPLALVAERAQASPRLRRSAERRLAGQAELEILRHRVYQLELRLAALEQRQPPASGRPAG